jgi:hypothetical protein
MINESQSDSESTTQIAKAPNSIEQVHVSYIIVIWKFELLIQSLIEIR